MHSQTVSNFYKVKILSTEYPNMKAVFQSHSYEIFMFLDSKDLLNLKLTNKFFYDVCDCHQLLNQSIKSLQILYFNSLFDGEDGLQNSNTNDKSNKKSKFKEKYDFNKSINQFYKGTEIYNQRIQSAKRKKKK